MSNQPFVIERIFNAPIDTVWRAISDRDEMEKWYFKLPEFKVEKGFEFEFSGGPSEDKIYLHKCKITEVIAGKKLAYSWIYDGYDGYSVVSFELFAEGDKTRLILTHEGLETFPADNPDFAKESFVTGWTSFMDMALKEYIDKLPH